MNIQVTVKGPNSSCMFEILDDRTPDQLHNEIMGNFLKFGETQLTTIEGIKIIIPGNTKYRFEFVKL